MFDVITLGAATRDVFLVSKDFQFIQSHKFATGVGECVPFGAKIDIDNILLSSGGGATNAAVTFARLGLSAGIVAKVGDDEAGRGIKTELHGEGVDVRLMKTTDKDSTAYSTLLTAKNGERSVLVYRGASATFAPSDISWTKLKAKWIYASSLAGNLDVMKQVLTHAHKHKIKVAFNPGKGELKRATDMRKLLPKLSILIVNLEEAQMLTENPDKDVAKQLKLLAQPNLTVVITNGPSGAYALADGTAWYARTSGVKSVSRTGAGDAFGSGLTAALIKGYSLDDAMKIGTLNSESVIQKFGAKAGILNKWPSKKDLAKYSVRKVR